MITMDLSWRELLAFRSDLNEVLHVEDVPTGVGTALDENGHQYPIFAVNDYRLVVQVGNVLRRAHINNRDDSQEEFDAFKANILPLANKVVWSMEKCFDSPDYVTRKTWHSRSTGDHVIWFIAKQTGSVDGNGNPLFARDPLDAKTWIAAAGLADLQAFGAAYAAGDMATAFGHLYAARQHPIAAKFSDIIYTWFDLNGNRLAYFNDPAQEWRANDETVLSKYDPVSDAWVAQNPATNAWDVGIFAAFGIETSRQRLNPDPGYKMVFSETFLRAAKTVNFNYTQDPITNVETGMLRYIGHGFADASSGAPFPGVFTSADANFQYRYLREFKSRANDSKDVDDEGLLTFVIDYSKTKPIILDALKKQYVDIVIAGDVLMTGSPRAQASFILVKWRSF